MLGLDAPWRTLSHPDGRRWMARVEGVELHLRIELADGDVIERSRTFANGDAADRELAGLIAEQLADGFSETSAPIWRGFLDRLVAHWAEDDPGFDAPALRDRVLASTSPAAAEIVEHLMGLADRWVAQPDGSARMDMDASEPARCAAWLEAHADAASPALLLGLRHPDYGAQLAVESILMRIGHASMIPALLSVIERPAANRAAHLGGRPQHFPVSALAGAGPPSPELASRLADAMDHDDFRIADAAAAALAEHATDAAIVDAMLIRAERARASDGFAASILRAAEVSRDARLKPSLEWMQRSRRFRSAGYPERIREALDRLR